MFFFKVTRHFIHHFICIRGKCIFDVLHFPYTSSLTHSHTLNCNSKHGPNNIFKKCLSFFLCSLNTYDMRRMNATHCLTSRRLRPAHVAFFGAEKKRKQAKARKLRGYKVKVRTAASKCTFWKRERTLTKSKKKGLSKRYSMRSSSFSLSLLYLHI